MTILINDPGYTVFQRKLITLAFDKVYLINNNNKAKIISILTKRKKIIAFGVNNEEVTHPAAGKFVHFKIHAELNCVLKVRWYDIDYRKCDLWNIRIKRNNEISMSRPCRRCYEFLSIMDIKNIYYTDWEGNFKKYSDAYSIKNT